MMMGSVRVEQRNSRGVKDTVGIEERLATTVQKELLMERKKTSRSVLEV